MTAAQIVGEELNIPTKYIKDTTKSDHVEALVHYSWIRQILNNGNLPEKFVSHDTLSSEEVNAWFKQGENFGSQWKRIIIKVMWKYICGTYMVEVLTYKIIAKSNQTVIPLPRTKTGSKPDTILTYSQVLHYVTQTNHKNLWKEAYKKFNHGLLIENRRRDSCTVELTDATTVMREVIARAYSCPVIQLDDSCQPQQESDTSYETHPNILPSSVVMETEKHFLLIHEGVLDYTLQDCVSFSPAVLSGSHSKPLFVVYQLLRVMRHLHDYGLALGDITLSDIQLTDDLWIQVLPHLEANIYKIPKCTDSNCSSKKSELKHSVPSVTELANLCAAWVQGAVSNFDYLTALNKLAGRRYGDPRSHHVFPWVTDFASNTGTNWRDLTKSKFRLNKGDRQLDLTYELPPNCSSAQTLTRVHPRFDYLRYCNADNQTEDGHVLVSENVIQQINKVPHHISEVLSEITYYVYLARVTPKSILCKYVRPQWVPAEYPSSIQRLQQWTPDECIPEFFTNPSVFKSIHSDLPDLEVPAWASSPEELVTFHRNALESVYISERLHHWIDLTFGYKLSGLAAVKSKNVCLQLVDGHTQLMDTGVVQLFTQPHPQRTGPSVYWSITPPRLHHTPHKERRKTGSEEEYCHSSGEDEEIVNTNGNTSRPSPLALSRFLSRSRTSLQPTAGGAPSSPSSEPTNNTSEKPTAPTVPTSTLALPHDYNPTAALMALENLHSFVTKTCHTVGCGVNTVEYNEVMAFKQVVAARRLQEMQVLGCLIVEIFLASKLRVFGVGIEPVLFSKRLQICRTVLQASSANHDSIPRCVRGLVSLLLQIDITTSNSESVCCYESPVTSLGIPPPSAHQLLQANLTSTILPFPNNFPIVYTIMKTLHEYSSALKELHAISSTLQVSEGSNKQESLTAIIERVCEWKVKSIANDLERLVEDTLVNSSTMTWLDLILPHILNMLASPNTSILTAWHLFDPIARALGPARCSAVLLEPMVHLYDCNSERHSTLPETTHRLKKRIKIYHRSFLLCLIVRFKLRIFLDNFVSHLVEAVGGYQDSDQFVESADFNQLVDCEGGAEWEAGAAGGVLSPLDEDSSADSERNQPGTQDCAAQETDAEVEPEVFVLDPEESCTDDDDSEQAKRNGDKSVPSVLLDQLDIQADEAEETAASEWSSAGTVEMTGSDEISTKWKKRSSDDEKLKTSPVEYSKVSEVSGDSVQWLAHRLGPVLTARYLSRNLLRMLSLCYAGHGCHTRYLHDFTKLVGDENASKVLECLTSVAALYGEQFIVIQYLPHMSDLIALCKRKFTINLEGGVIACLALLKHIIAYMADATIAHSLQELILKTIIHPAMRLLSSTRQIFPSGVPSRQAIAIKLVECLYVLALRVSTEQRIVLIHTLQRFFLAFSKARGYTTKSDNNPACVPSNSGENSCSDVVPKLCTAESTDSSPSPYSSPSPASDASEIFRSKALEEIQKAMSAELAHWAYTPFAKFYGESFMEQSLKNYTLIKELCLEFQKEQCLRNPVQGWDETSHFSDLEAVHVGGKLDGEECGVVVVGNRMDIQEPVVKTGSPNVSSGPADDITNSSGKTVECNSRHLRGNWLAYWEHEIGRSGKDNHFNVKQIKLQSYSGHCNSIRALTVLDNENSFLSASRDKSVKVWSLRSQGDGNTVSGSQWTYSGHRKSVMALGFVERVRLAVSCDSTVHLWDPFVGRVISQTNTTRAPPVNTLRPLHPPSAAILTANTDATLRTLDTRICSYVSELKVSTSGAGLIRCIAVSPAGQWVALGQASGFLTILDLRTGTVIAAWKGHEGEVLQLVAVNEHTIVSSSLDQAVSVWNVADGKLRFNLKGPTEPVHCLDMYGTELISGTTANRIGVHTAVDINSSFSSTRLRSDSFKGILTALHVLPLNRLLLLGADTGAISLLC